MGSSHEGRYIRIGQRHSSRSHTLDIPAHNGESGSVCDTVQLVHIKVVLEVVPVTVADALPCGGTL